MAGLIGYAGRGNAIETVVIFRVRSGVSQRHELNALSVEISQFTAPYLPEKYSRVAGSYYFRNFHDDLPCRLLCDGNVIKFHFLVTIKLGSGRGRAQFFIWKCLLIFGRISLG
jgi:hypothetical protein